MLARPPAKPAPLPAARSSWSTVRPLVVQSRRYQRRRGPTRLTIMGLAVGTGIATSGSTAAPAPHSPREPAVRLSGVRKVYGDVVAVQGLSLEVTAGEFFTMLGPSGSGKTTTLRVIAGFELADAGTVHLHGLDVTTSPPFERPVNTVFQDYAL